MECFQRSGKSLLAKQVLMMFSSGTPMASKPSLKNSYAQAVRAAGRGVRHAIDHVVQGGKVYSIYVKTA